MMNVIFILILCITLTSYYIYSYKLSIIDMYRYIEQIIILIDILKESYYNIDSYSIII